MSAHHGHTTGSTVTVAGATNPANNGNFTIQPVNPYIQPGINYGNIGGALGGGLGGPGQQWHWNTTTVTEKPKSSLELFEELVGLIRELEVSLNLNAKDVNKDKWLETIMGRIQEETINSTLQRLKALKI